MWYSDFRTPDKTGPSTSELVMEESISPVLDSSRSFPAIAVVGMGCWYPGAPSLRSLWENILARRREFRRLPACRLLLADYHDPNPNSPDKTYGQRAALIDGFQFDWAKRRSPQPVFVSTDIVHWLALTVACKAMEDACAVSSDDASGSNGRHRWQYPDRRTHPLPGDVRSLAFCSTRPAGVR